MCDQPAATAKQVSSSRLALDVAGYVRLASTPTLSFVGHYGRWTIRGLILRYSPRVVEVAVRDSGWIGAGSR